MKRATKCPSTLASYKEAVMKKNCLSLTAETQRCRSFEYHCVLSDDFQHAIEVCAPSILIIGKILFLKALFLDRLKIKKHALHSLIFAWSISISNIYLYISVNFSHLYVKFDKTLYNAFLKDEDSKFNK